MLIESSGLSWIAIIGIALGTMMFGYFFGLFEGRGQGYKRRKEEEHTEIKDLHIPPPALPSTTDDPGLLRLKNENNQLRLDMDGQRVDTSVPLPPALRKRLIDLLTLVRPFLEGGTPPSVPAQRPATPPPAVLQQAPVQTPSSRPAPITPEERAMFSAPVQPKVEPVPAKISLGLPKKKDEQPVKPLSMVEQIDEILQLKIINTPLASLGIKIQEGPGGVVNVLVGDKKYEGIGDVPDPNVQAVLRAAVAEWEKKYTPGL